MMCDVPSTAVFGTESIECCPGIVSRYFCKLLLTIPVAPMITAMTKHFMFHIHWISVLIFINYSFFSASFCTTFLSDGIDTSINKQVLSFLFLIIMSGLFSKTSLSVLPPWFHKTVISSCSVTDLGMWEYQFLVSIPHFFHIEYCICVHTLSCRIMYSFFARVGHPDVRWSIFSSYSLYRLHLLSISCFKLLLNVICTNCLVLSCHYGDFCFCLNASKL
jgi:hypothetical protein